MKKIVVLIQALFFTQLVFAQTFFKERYKIELRHAAEGKIIKKGQQASYYGFSNDPNTAILYVDTSIAKNLCNVTLFIYKHNKNNDTVFQANTSTDYSKGKVLPADTFYNAGHFFCDIRQSNDTLYFYPWPFCNGNKHYKEKSAQIKPEEVKKENRLISKSEFFYKIPTRVIQPIFYRAFRFSAITIPFKAYLSSKNGLTNNTNFGVNVDAAFGLYFGKKKFYFLPNQKNGQFYNKLCSVSYLLGISQVALDHKNSAISSDETYNVAAVTTGFSFGYNVGSFGIFVASGVDLPFGNYASRWNYGFQPWVGFGFSYGIN